MNADNERQRIDMEIGQVLMFLLLDLLQGFGNRLVENPKQRLTAEETWKFCLHGLSD